MYLTPSLHPRNCLPDFKRKQLWNWFRGSFSLTMRKLSELILNQTLNTVGKYAYISGISPLVL